MRTKTTLIILVAAVATFVVGFYAGNSQADRRWNRMLSDSRVAAQPTSISRGRKIGDIQFSRDVTQGKVAAVWGAPDAHRGSGIPYEAYRLEDGREVWIYFSPEKPRRILGALLVSPDKTESLLPE